MQRRLLSGFCGAGLSLALLAGCGGSAPTGDKSAEPSGLPTASIGGGKSKNATDEAPAPGSPEWNLLEIGKIRVQPAPDANKLSVDKLADIRRERNEKVIDLATAVIAATHDDPKQEPSFVAGVHHLMEARTQLALQGAQEDVDALYADCETLQAKYPKSKAAAEAAFARVLYARTNATLHALREPRWLDEFARQARLFAAGFPDEEARALVALQAAARSCELNQRSEAAAGCYAEIEKRYPNHQHAAQATAALRRLHLKGQRLELAGPTLEGGFARIDDFAGKTVLVCFWDTESEEFLKAAPMIQAVAKKYAKHGLAVVGVNLDEEEADVTEFLEKHPMPWPHIFHPDPVQRRWDNPVAKHYGVLDVPNLWLVNAEGVVLDTAVQPETLEAQVREALQRQMRAAAGDAASGASGSERPRRTAENE